MLHGRAFFFDRCLELCQPLGAPQGVQGAVHRNAMGPRPELRLAPPRRQRTEDLDPHVLRDVRREVRVTGKSPDYRVHVWGIPRPERAEGPFIAANGAPDDLVIRLHAVRLIGHVTGGQGLPREGDGKSERTG